METNKSCEKLVAVEEGLISPEKLTHFPFVGSQRHRGRSNKLTNYLLAFLSILLLAVVAYEIWQSVSNQQIVKVVETQTAQSQEKQLPLVRDDTRIQEMAEELERLQNALKDIMKRIDEPDPIPTTTVLPTIASSSSQIVDDMNPPNSERITEDISNSPMYPILEKDVSQDSDQSESFIPVLITQPIGEEIESGFRWSFMFGYGGRPEEKDTSEETEETDEEEPDSASSEERWMISSPESIPPAKEQWGWIWEWKTNEEDSKDSESGVKVEQETISSSNEEDSKDSESEENVEEKIESDDIKTEEFPVGIRFDGIPDLYQDYYANYDESDEFDEYPNWMETVLNTKNEDVDITTEKSPEDVNDEQQIPTTENSSTSPDSESEDTTEIDESQKDETTTSLTTEPGVYHFFSDDSSDFWGLGLLADNLSQSLWFGSAPDSEDAEDGSTSTEKTLERLLAEDDLLSNREMIDKYFQDLLAQRLAEAEFLDRYMENVFAGEYAASTEDEEPETSVLEDSDDYVLGPFRPRTPSTSASDEWSYISKRSVDTPPGLGRPDEVISPKELERKIELIRQEIDDDNHLLQNEVSHTSEPAKHILQAKLNNFYTKMEAVSAHIDRLHQRFLRLNKLEDDYVSRELPASEEVEAPLTSNN